MPPRKSANKLLIPEDTFMSEVVTTLLELSYKIASKNPKRFVYNAAYKAAHDALLHALEPEELDKIVAWLWEQGIPKMNRMLVLGTLGHQSPVNLTDRQLSEEMGEWWCTNLGPKIRETTAKVLLNSMMKEQVANRDDFKKRGDVEKDITHPAAQRIRSRLKSTSSVDDSSTDADYDSHIDETPRENIQNTAPLEQSVVSRPPGLHAFSADPRLIGRAAPGPKSSPSDLVATALGTLMGARESRIQETRRDIRPQPQHRFTGGEEQPTSPNNIQGQDPHDAATHPVNTYPSTGSSENKSARKTTNDSGIPPAYRGEVNRRGFGGATYTEIGRIRKHRPELRVPEDIQNDGGEVFGAKEEYRKRQKMGDRTEMQRPMVSGQPKEAHENRRGRDLFDNAWADSSHNRHGGRVGEASDDTRLRHPRGGPPDQRIEDEEDNPFLNPTRAGGGGRSRGVQRAYRSVRGNGRNGGGGDRGGRRDNGYKPSDHYRPSG